MHTEQLDQFKQFDQRYRKVLRSWLTVLFVVAVAYSFSHYAPSRYENIPSWLKWGGFGVMWLTLDFGIPMSTAPERMAARHAWARSDKRRLSTIRALSSGFLVLLLYPLFCAFPLNWLGIAPSLTFVAVSGAWLGLTTVLASELWYYYDN